MRDCKEATVNNAGLLSAGYGSEGRVRLDVRVQCDLIQGLDIRVNASGSGLEAIGHFDWHRVIES